MTTDYHTATYPTLREANQVRQAEWDPGDHARKLSWRINELAGEAGETCNILKKLHRERCGVVGTRATSIQLAEELADVVICLDLTAMQEGLTPLSLKEAQQLIPEHQWENLTEAGCDLIAAIGKIANNWRLAHDVPTASQKFMDCCNVLAIVHLIAGYERIDLDHEVSKKFNATSIKMNLTTRLAPPYVKPADVPPQRQIIA